MLWDCITFNNELDLLEIRLNVLDSIVDKFVITEAVKTHTGLNKPLYFNENKSRYAKFKDKIVHIIIDELPKYENSWTYESYQRDYMINALKSTADNDVIMISDADEIPNPAAVSESKNLPGIKSLHMYTYMYFINNLAVGRNCTDFQTTKIVNMKDIRCGILDDSDTKTTLTKIKFYHGINDKQTLIKNGGWHFSTCGGKDVCSVKFLSNALHDDETYLKRLNLIKDYEHNLKLKRLWGEREYLCVVRMKGYFPEYITDNKEKYSHLIKKGFEFDIRFTEICITLARKIKNFSRRVFAKIKNAKNLFG